MNVPNFFASIVRPPLRLSAHSIAHMAVYDNRRIVYDGFYPNSTESLGKEQRLISAFLIVYIKPMNISAAYMI